ncbi:MAG TPA: response regulator [Terriglobales bacterium]|nr:response regulator [Terriglobales bacterium]
MNANRMSFELIPPVVATPVLVIEDEPSVMAFVQAALERAGYAVVPAGSGAEALGLLAQQRPFLGVVSDMRTPGGVDGADVHSWISNNRPELLSRVIFITGDIVSEETAATLRRTGAACLEKPFRVQQFLAVVSQVIGEPQ